MSDLSCNNCGKDAELGYCRKCDEGTNDYCADLRKQVKRAQAWAAIWKVKAKQKREWCHYQAETISTMIVQRATDNPDYLPPNSRKLRAERDAAQALVETLEKEVARLRAKMQHIQVQADDTDNLFMARKQLAEMRHTTHHALNGDDANYYDSLPFEDRPAPVNPDAPVELETPDFSTELGWLRHIKLVAREMIDAVKSPMETWGNEEHPVWQAYWSLALSMGEYELWRKEHDATFAQLEAQIEALSNAND